MHPDLAITIARLRHDELIAGAHHHRLGRGSRRRFFRRRRDTAAAVVSRPADLVALPPPRDGREVDERRVA